MDQNIEVVKNLYTSERIVNEAKELKSYRKELKVWEKTVVSNFFPENGHVLDIGCYTGREAFNLYDMGFKVTAIDISEEIIEIAKQAAFESKRDIEFLLTNGLDLPFDNNSLDVIVIWSQTFGNLYGGHNQIHLLKECNRVLKKGGIISFSGHDKEFLEKNYPQLLDGKNFFFYKDTDCYWEIFTIPEMEDLAKRSGFEVLDCQRGINYNVEDGTILHCVCRK